MEKQPKKLMQSPENLRLWFANVVGSMSTDPFFVGVAVVNSFHYGDSQRIIGRMRSNIAYPALLLEFPSYKDTNGPNSQLFMSIGFVVMAQHKPDDYVGQDQTIDMSWKIGMRFIGKIKHYCQQNPSVVQYVGNVLADPIASYFADNNYGYRFELDVRVKGGCIC
jgi:hypothetical protein